MNRKTFLVVIVQFLCAFGFAQNEIETFYRKRKVDPIAEFFSGCDLRFATCVERGECAIENLSQNECVNKMQDCCLNQNNGNNGGAEGGAIVFPGSTSRPPTLRTTRKQTTRIPTKLTTTTTTTTTEEPIDEEWLTPDCGTQLEIGPNMDGVRDSNIGEFPWNVEIYSKNENDFGIVQNVFLCGGTLIDSFVVLTSGNCEMKNTSNLFVDAGVWNIEDAQEKRQMRKVKEVIKHKDFQQTSRVSSLALLVLDDQMDYSRTVNRVCLPEPDIDFTESTCFLTGWGGTGEDPSETIRSKMKVVNMNQLNHKECQEKIRRRTGKFTLRESLQCTEEEFNNHVCPFDVGSPLICTIPERENQFYQAGIFVWNQYISSSGNAVCSNSRVVNLFTDLRKFREWIDEQMEKLERNSNVYEPQPIF